MELKLYFYPMRNFFLFSFLLITIMTYGQSAGDYYLLIGTYSTTPSDGIEVYDYNSITGQYKFVGKAATKNPSYLAVSPDKKFIYSVAENGQPNGGRVVAFSFDMVTGTLTPINSQPSMGSSPCYVSVFKDGRHVAVGNYSSGNLAYYSVNEDGSLNAPQNIIHHGSSITKGNQDSPHVHAAVYSPDYKYLMVPDLGIDKVMIYPIDPNGNINTVESGFVQLAPGAGPRHIEFHPNGKWAYLMEEISGNVTALSYKNGKLKVLNSVNAYPADYKDLHHGADIHISPDGKYVYGSYRYKLNAIGIFKIDQKTGKVAPVATQSTMGEIPRNFNFDPSGNFLLVANQNSNDIVIFKVNKDTGLLTDTGNRLSVNKPVCIKWVKKM